jgi:uncharacterized protein (DUF1800 family)
MSIQREKIVRFARKVGFGFRPDEDFPSDPFNWIDSQLAEPRYYRGIASLASPTIVSEWPSSFNLTLKDRFNIAWDHRTKIRELEGDKSLSADMIKTKRREYELNHLPNWHDETRFYHRAIYAKDQVRQRLLHFWINHFFVSGDGPGSNVLLADHIERAIEDSLDGSFTQMLYNAVTSPAMLKYLDNTENIGENSKKAKIDRSKNKFSGLNDNLAREVLELHTVSPSMGYTENDIRAMAKILSGWGLSPNDTKRRGSAVENWYSPFEKDKAQRGFVEIFGMKLGSQFGTSEKGLADVLKYLSEHESSRDHLCLKLCIHFISDKPPKEAVDRVKSVWSETNGDLPSVHKQVLVETLGSMDTHSKFLWPMTWAMQALRQSGASLIDGWDDVNNNSHPFVSSANRFSREFGQGFFTQRKQPDGFPLVSEDWISPAHFERRLKFSLLIGRHGKPMLSALDLAEKLRIPDDDKSLIKRFLVPAEQWVALLCSRQLLEA